MGKWLWVFVGWGLMSVPARAAPDWSEDVHAAFIETAFAAEREDCRRQIRRGSEWVDSLPNQTPGKAYLHAMRTASQSEAVAREQMASFIQAEYEVAMDLFERSTERLYGTPADPAAQVTHDGRLIKQPFTYLAACNHRGRALHPVMDSTSPAHENFPIWSLSDIAGLFRHGDLPGSIENERALFARPDLKEKTVGLMLIVDKLYFGLGMKSFRFE